MEKVTPRDTGKGVAETFTGDDNIVAPQQPSRMVVTAVGFTPAARTHLHSHALGQVLHCTDGLGFAATRDGIVIVLRPGETGWTPPGEASAVLTLLTRRRSAVLARLAPRLWSSGAAVPAAARGEQ